MTILERPSTRLTLFATTVAAALALSACGERREPPASPPPAAPVSTPAPSQTSATKVPDTSTPPASGETAPTSGMLGRSDTAAPVKGSGTPPTPPATPEKSAPK